MFQTARDQHSFSEVVSGILLQDDTAAVSTTNNFESIDIFEGFLASIVNIVPVASGITNFSVGAVGVLALSSKLNLSSDICLSLVDVIFTWERGREIAWSHAVQDLGDIKDVVVTEVASSGTLNEARETRACILLMIKCEVRKFEEPFDVFHTDSFCLYLREKDAQSWHLGCRIR
jgi:hypothetical protein